MSCEGFLRDSPRLGLEGRNRNTTSELAEGVGFEPTVPCDTTVFETVRFVRSRIPPPKRLAATPTPVSHWWERQEDYGGRMSTVMLLRGRSSGAPPNRATRAPAHSPRCAFLGRRGK